MLSWLRKVGRQTELRMIQRQKSQKTGLSKP